MTEKEYPPLELKAPYWKERARKLLLSEYDDPKQFYGKYSEATDFYYELAKRITAASESSHESEAYALMYSSFMEDAKSNSHEQLDELIELYSELNKA